MGWDGIRRMDETGRDNGTVLQMLCESYLCHVRASRKLAQVYVARKFCFCVGMFWRLKPYLEGIGLSLY